MQTTTLQQALERYTAAYNNANYMDIRRQITVNLFGKDVEYTAHEADQQVVDLMNMLQDTCLECYGASQHSGSHIQLALLAAWSKLSDETINMIYHYLLTFQQAGNTTAEDFEATAKALRHIYTGQSEINITTAHANGVHGWCGRMAYELLAAAEYLLKAAELLLQHHNDQTYIREKLKHGLGRITGALYEGIRHSPQPELFNFKSTYFPTEKDRF
ncbi:MAG: hypothetical protein JNJ61_29700 [Anaerolineae bacterium]|nr:hypothetical protein [Anaerolineae bacterium]